MMHRKKILIVDPSPIARRELKETIENSETLVDVYAVADVDQANEILRRHQPDAAFVEIDLPLNTGPGLIETIRQSAPESHIIALTGTESEAVKTAARANGVDDFLTKQMAVGFRLIDFIHEVIRR